VKNDVRLTFPELESIITLLEKTELSCIDNELQFKVKSKLKQIYKNILEGTEEKRELKVPDFRDVACGTMVVRSPLLKNSSWAYRMRPNYVNGRGLIVGFRYYYKEIIGYSVYGAPCLPVVHWELDIAPRVMNPLFVELEKSTELPKMLVKFTKKQEDYLSEFR
jgi:hypothetical protein